MKATMAAQVVLCCIAVCIAQSAFASGIAPLSAGAPTGDRLGSAPDALGGYAVGGLSFATDGTIQGVTVGPRQRRVTGAEPARPAILPAMPRWLVPDGPDGNVLFSNVTIMGSLAAGASFMTGPNDIDFILPDAVVGDPAHPRRLGTIIITYIAESTLPQVMDEMVISMLGALSGSGTIFFNEVVEDVINPGVIAMVNFQLTGGPSLPHVQQLPFSRPSTKVKVKKTLTLVAMDTPGLDVAAVPLLSQRLHVVPEPTAGLLAFSGLFLIVARRRRRDA